MATVYLADGRALKLLVVGAPQVGSTLMLRLRGRG